MSDRYQSFTGTGVGQFLVKSLGLPDPVPLRRHRDGDPVVSGPVLMGGSGTALPAAVAALRAAGADVQTEREDGVRYAGLVFDAAAIESVDGLLTLREFFTPVLRSLDRCAHVLVLGTSPGRAASPAAQIAQRAVEGFTRSLGKEIGRGGTVNLVYVEPGAETRIASTVTFLLSPKSAYVSGQVVYVGQAVAPPDLAGVDPQRPLDGLVAAVTGASRGIGESIARTLHRDGATVVGIDVPQAADGLTRLVRDLAGADTDAVSLDITAVDAPQRVARTLVEQHGGVDIVVHNAGITRDKKLANMDTQRWSSVLDVNLSAPQRITEHLFAEGVFRPNGRVVGVASIAGIAGNLGQTNYAASKAGVIGMVDAMASLAAERAVTVNAVAPGFIETQMTAAIPLLLREAGRRMNSMSQGGLPIDVAETVAWLASPESYGVTGNVVRVCGQSLLGA